MKKFLSFIFVLMMAFVLVACKETPKVTVEYETNGAAEIASEEITLENVGTYQLPADPVKEGYLFRGWYVDEACAEEFLTLPSEEKTIKLYAKWVEDTLENRLEGKGLNVSATINFTLDLTSTEYQYIIDDEDEEIDWYDVENEVKEGEEDGEDEEEWYFDEDEDWGLDDEEEPVLVTETTKVNVNVNVGLSVKQVVVEDINDLDAMFTVVVSYTDLESLIALPTTIAITCYVDNGYLYLSIPSMLTAKVKLVDVYNALVAKVETLAGEEETVEFNEEYINELKEQLTETINGLKTQYGISDELITKVINILKGALPVKTVTGSTTKYEITKAQLDAVIDNLAKFVTDESDTIIEIITNAMSEDPEEQDEPKEEVTIEDYGTLYRSTGKFVTVGGEEFYVYNDTEGFYGCYIDENSTVYYCMINDAYYLVSNGTLLTEEQVAEMFPQEEITTWTDALDNVYNTGEAFCTDTEGEKHYFKDDLETGAYGYYEESYGVYMVYASEEMFDVTTWKLTTLEELTKKAYKLAVEQVALMITSLKDCYDIKALNASYTVNEENLISNANANVEVSAQYGEEGDENFSVSIKFTANADVTYVAEFEMPTFSATYVDMTETITTLINSLNLSDMFSSIVTEIK